MEITLEQIETLLDNKLQAIAYASRNDIQKRLCSIEDAQYILSQTKTIDGILKHDSKDCFYKLLKDPKNKIKKSLINGKYITQSIYDEADRLSRTSSSRKA